MSQPKRLTHLSEATILSELETFPNQAVIWGILGEANKGQIWELPGYKGIMLLEDNSDDPFVFIAGPLDASDVKKAISLCPTYYPMIYCNPVYHHLFLAEGWDFNLRIQLAYTTPTSQNLNKNWVIKPIDNIALFQRCLGFKSSSARYGSSDSFLKNGKGYALCEGTVIVSEAYIDYQGHSYAEIGVITHPDYRRQGAAAQIASYLVEECKAQEIIPVWSCQVNNRASLQTGLKIGFRIERYYVSMVPKVGNTLSPALVDWINDEGLTS